MVDIVAAEPGPHELLKEIGLLVRALGRAEAGERASPLTTANALQPGGGAVERLVPAGLAKVGVGIGRVYIGVVLGDTVPADQRLGQAVRVVGVVESKPTLDAQPVMVGRAIFAVDRDDPIVADLIGQLAAD